jgi:Homeodomain-like domain
MISKEREAQILRLHHAEGWPAGTIARELGVHHTTVQRVLAQSGIPSEKITARPSVADPYIPFIIETLTTYPRLCASRVFEMVHKRGYPGGPDHFRRVVARLRPRPPAEAFLRLRTLPGEQAQVDWAHFGKVAIGRALRRPVCLREGARVVAGDLLALLPQRGHAQLPARPRRGVRVLRGCASRPLVR